MKPSGIGGQAVIEGVMMKNKDHYAVAVRKPDNEIVVELNNYVSKAEKIKLFKLPIFRGMLAFVESMVIGSKTLTFSASFFEEEEESKETKVDKAFSKIFKDKAESIIMGITFIIAVLFAMGIFVVLPAYIANLLSEKIESGALRAVVEGLIRISLFILYVFAISQLKDIKRVFMYHGAEHKTINCLEQGFELTVENVKWQSREHKRCGTSFMFIVMFVSIIFFIFIRVDAQWLRYLIRILLIPVIAGVSYEFIRLAGRSNSKIVDILSRPGMWLQGLTTKEPEDAMIEVAIKSVEAVFDWKDFLGIADTAQNEDAAEKSTKHKKKNNAAGNSKSGNGSANNNKNASNKKNQRKGTTNNKPSSSADNKNRNKKASNNISSKTGNRPTSHTSSRKSLLMEEDDEILKALEDIVASKEENLDKE